VKTAIGSGRSFLDRYTAICESIFQLARRHPLYFEGLIGNINVDIESESTPVIYKKIYALGEQLNSELEELINAGKEEGLIASNLPSSALLEYLWGGISGIIRMLLQKPGYLRIQNLNENQFADFCFERLLCGCRPQVNQEMKK
ncbi:MAG: hypothetical protein VB096_06025, partial [Pseudoflavonifractor sp.]|nr:hypothetical protein [Pseudoflavonifractor sp.]